MTTAASSDEGSRLCLACGLCCSGAVFSFVPVEPHEMGRLHTRLPVVHEPGQAEPHFALPCPAHQGGGCSLYRERPDVCASYACKQLRGVRAGRISLDQALRTVGQVKELFQRVATALPVGGWVWSRARALHKAAPPEALEERRRHAATLLDLKLLDVLIDREIEERSKRDDEAPPAPGTGA